MSRPRPSAREVLDQARARSGAGLFGDSWGTRVLRRTRQTQLNVMNARVIALIAQDRARWPLAGDQLYVDLDLADDNLPPGSRLEIGSAVIEVSAEPHPGCGKFVQRFGVDAMKFVNSPLGRQLHLRGINARVVRAGRGARRRSRAEDEEPSGAIELQRAFYLECALPTPLVAAAILLALLDRHLRSRASARDSSKTTSCGSAPTT